MECAFFFNFSKLSKHLRMLTPLLMKFHLFKMIERNSEAAVLSCLNGGTQFWFLYNFFGHYRNCPDWLQGLSSEWRISSVRLHHWWRMDRRPQTRVQMRESETSNLGAFACKVNICITRRWQRVLWSADYHRDEHLQRQHFHLREAERRVIGYELQYWLSLRACSARQQEYGTLHPPLSIMKWRGKRHHLTFGVEAASFWQSSLSSLKVLWKGAAAAEWSWRWNLSREAGDWWCDRLFWPFIS